jgi:hypothetical protein
LASSISVNCRKAASAPARMSIGTGVDAAGADTAWSG